jgi:hypothetical protein
MQVLNMQFFHSLLLPPPPPLQNIFLSTKFAYVDIVLINYRMQGCGVGT